jgi:hypothetical protein
MIWTRIRTAVIVTVITALVWVFAEAESLRAQEVALDVVLEAEPGGDRLVVDLVDPSSSLETPQFVPGTALVRATIQVEGGTGAVDGLVRRARRSPIRIAPGMEGLPKTPGVHSVRLAEALRAHPELRGLGITVKKADPESCRVGVDELVSREVPVSVPASESVEGLAEAKPGLVWVFLPGRDAKRLTASSAAVARPDERAISALIPGRRATVPGVRVEPPAEVAGALHLRVEPPAVDVTLTPRARQSSIRLSSVPVHVRMAPAELAKFEVEVPEADRTIFDVTVSGPADLVRQVEDKTLPVVAVVPLSFEELERGIATKDAVFTSMPSLLKFEAANRTVHLRIRRREPGAN